MLKENLGPHKGLDSKGIRISAAFAVVGLIGMILFRKDLREIFPPSDKEQRRLKEAEKIQIDVTTTRQTVRQTKLNERKLERLRKAFDERQHKLDKTFETRRAAYEARLDKYLSEQNVSDDIAENAKAISMKDSLDVLKYGKGFTLNHLDPVSLAITIPIEPRGGTLSWLGGNPYLPADIAWPHIKDEPCNFYTQIYCPDLPPGIWGGLGPKTGWLSFFCSPKNFGNVKILHTESLGSERPAPVPPNHYRGYKDARSAYNEAVGDASNLAPKWPITIKNIPGLEVLNSDMRSELKGNPYENARNFIGENIKAEHCQPFDQVTFKKMIDSFQTYIDEEASADTQVKFLSYKNLDWTPHYRARVETKQTFEAFKSNIENSFAIEGFSQALAIKYIDGLSLVPTTDWWPEHMKDHHSTLANAPTPSRDYLKFLEVYLRMSYTEDKSAIPGAYLKPWETYWGYAVESELGQCGGHIGGFQHRISESVVRLLELPCSLLMGWHFGDASTFGFFISPSDLEAGNWDAAFGDISN